MKKALILQHEEVTPLNSTLSWLNKNHFENQICRLDLHETLPDYSIFDLIIICGGVTNVDEEHLFPWLIEEKKFVKKTIESGKKVVGLCLGSQLISEVLGAKVARHPHLEIGWHPVQLIPDGKIIKETDSKKLMVFQWHGYSWQLPLGAELIATNQACVGQGLKYKDNVIGFQFHPEATYEWVIECANDPIIPEGPYCQNKQQILNGNEKLQPVLQSWYHQILDRFVSETPAAEIKIKTHP